MAFSLSKFIMVNGFSSCYGFKGLEYIDIGERLKKVKFKLHRKSKSEGIYYFLANDDALKVEEKPSKINMYVY